MAAQQPQQLPVPNIVNLQAAVNGMTAEANTIAQSAQAYNAHQQQFTTELSLCANFPVVQIQQQLTTLNQSMTNMQAMMNAQFWNLKAQMLNLKVNHATGALIVMRSLEQGPNPRVAINQAIPNFPGTPDQISQMNGTFPFLVLHFFSLLAKLLIILRRASMSQYPNIPRYTFSSSSWNKTASHSCARSDRTSSSLRDFTLTIGHGNGVTELKNGYW
ncbi:hypothetical protein V2W45_1414983 [Cenococcum geophilum]